MRILLQQKHRWDENLCCSATQASLKLAHMILIKKYANRRLYDTSSSSYITLTNCAELIRAGKNVRIIDASTEHDITASVMIQIIQEREQETQILPISALRQIICAYDSEAEIFLTRYLERTLSSFARHHKHLDTALNKGIEAIQKDEVTDLNKPQAHHDETHQLLKQLKDEMDQIQTRLNKLEP